MTFAKSSGDRLREALTTLGRNETVLSLCDDLSTGPIDVVDHAPRAAWTREVLGMNDDRSESVDAFWRTVSALRGNVIAWMSSRDVTELCGLHELLWRLDDRARVSIVDVANIEITNLNPASVEVGASMAFLFVFPWMTVGQNLVDRAVPLSSARRAEYRARWLRLRADNAALRILESPGQLRSAPLTNFDPTILSCVTSEWQRCLRVVGESLNRTSPGFVRQTCNVDFLFSRLQSLVDLGTVEGRSDVEPWTMRESWVRLRSTSIH